MGHLCYSCNPSNSDHVFTHQDAPAANYPMRFNGPPGSANGGIAVGSLTCPALAAANGGLSVTRITARLRRAVVCALPLTVDTTFAEAATSVAIRSQEGSLIEGVVTLGGASTSPAADAPLIAELAQVARAGDPRRPPFFEETGDHPIPACFSCGPEHPDGLHIYPRVVEDGLTCAPWHASAEFDDGDGAISPMIVASALDCSSGICMPIAMQRDLLDEDRFFLLGSLEVHYLRRPPVDRDYRVVAKAGAREGRKFFGMSALFDGDGVAYAMAEATWLVAGISRTEAFGAR